MSFYIYSYIVYYFASHSLYIGGNFKMQIKCAFLEFPRVYSMIFLYIDQVAMSFRFIQIIIYVLFLGAYPMFL